MKNEFKTNWIIALRSGDYTQFHGSIGIDNNLCCIGVGGAVAHLSQSFGWYTDEVAEAIGLHEFEQMELIRLNDELRAPFTSIADWIEINIETRD